MTGSFIILFIRSVQVRAFLEELVSEGYDIRTMHLLKFAILLDELSDPAHNTKYSRVQYLIAKGYVRYMNINGKPTKKLQLTEKGRRVAELVSEMHDVLSGYE